MENLGDHRSQLSRILTGLMAVLVLGTPGSVAAQQGDEPFDWPTTIEVDTNPDSVVVDAETGGAAPGGGGGSSGGGGPAPSCYLRAVPTEEWTDGIQMEYWRFRMQRAPYYVTCHGEITGVVWIEIALDEPGTGDESGDPRAVAMRLRDEIPVPRASIHVNPEHGLVGVESWFWIEGYDGVPISDSTDAFGSLVEVEARVTSYEWSFGDGTTIASATAGSAYPERSEVRHVYERSSAGMPGGYPVEVTFVFEVRYRVDGSGWSILPGISREVRADYPVRESQAVIHR